MARQYRYDPIEEARSINGGVLESDKQAESVKEPPSVLGALYDKALGGNLDMNTLQAMATVGLVNSVGNRLQGLDADQKRYAGSLWSGVGGMSYGAGKLADQAGLSRIGNELQYAGREMLNAGDWAQQQLPEARTWENSDSALAYATDPNAGWANLLNLGGSMSAMMPFSRILGGVIGGGASLAGKAITKAAPQLGNINLGAKIAPTWASAADKLGKIPLAGKYVKNGMTGGVNTAQAAGMSELARTLNRNMIGAAEYAAGSAPVESTMEKGMEQYEMENLRADAVAGKKNEQVDRLRKLGIDPAKWTDEQINSATNKQWLQNMTMLPITNLPEGLIFGKTRAGLNRKPLSKEATGFLTKVARGTVAAIPEGLTNAGEEGWQEGFGMGARGEDYSINPVKWFTDSKYAQQKTSAIEGGIGSFVLGLAGGATNRAGDALDHRSEDMLGKSYEEWAGKPMPSGENGCVEAVVRLAGDYSSFARANANENNVDNLTAKAEDAGILKDFNESSLERGDIIVYGDNAHVVVYDGDGGYYGNSSKQQKVLHGEDFTQMDGLKPTKIIKTGGSMGLNANPTVNANASDTADTTDATDENTDVKPDTTDSTKDNTETPKETKEQDVTDGLFSRFAEQKLDTAIGTETANEIGDMFKADKDGNQRFVNTPENRARILKKYGQEAWDAYQKANAQTKANQEQMQPKDNPHVDKAKEQQKNIIELPEGKSNKERRSQGESIINQAKGQDVKLPGELETKLRHGDPDAITASQAILNSQQKEAPQQENVSPEVQQIDEQIRKIGQQLNEDMNRGMRWTDVQAMNNVLGELVKRRAAAQPAQIEAPKESPAAPVAPTAPANYNNTTDITTIDPASLNLEARKNLGKAILRRAKAAGVEVSNRMAKAAEIGAGDGIRKLQKKVKKAEADKNGKNSDENKRQEQVHTAEKNRKDADTAPESGKEPAKQSKKSEDKTAEDKVKPGKEEARKKVIDGVLKKTPRQAYEYAISPLRGGYRGSNDLVQEVANNAQEYLNAHTDTLAVDEVDDLRNALGLIEAQYGIKPTAEDKSNPNIKDSRTVAEIAKAIIDRADEIFKNALPDDPTFEVVASAKKVFSIEKSKIESPDARKELEGIVVKELTPKIKLFEYTHNVLREFHDILDGVKNSFKKEVPILAIESLRHAAEEIKRVAKNKISYLSDGSGINGVIRDVIKNEQKKYLSMLKEIDDKLHGRFFKKDFINSQSKSKRTGIKEELTKRGSCGNIFAGNRAGDVEHLVIEFIRIGRFDVTAKYMPLAEESVTKVKRHILVDSDGNKVDKHELDELEALYFNYAMPRAAEAYNELAGKGTTKNGTNQSEEDKGRRDVNKTTGDTDWNASVEHMRISSIIDDLKQDANNNPSGMYLNYNDINTLMDYAKRVGLENDLLDDVKHSSSVKWPNEKVSALLRYLEELRLTTLNTSESDERLINKINDLYIAASRAHTKVASEVGGGKDIVDLKMAREVSDDIVKEAKSGKAKLNEIRKWANIALTIADKNEKILNEAIKAYEDLLSVANNDDVKANALEAVLKDHYSSTKEIKEGLNRLKQGLANIPELRKIEADRAEKLNAIADEKEGKRPQAQTEDAKSDDSFNGYNPSVEEKKILTKPFMNRGGKEWTPKEIIDSIVANDGNFIDKLTNGARFVYSKAREKTSKLWLMEEQPNGVKTATNDIRLPYQAEGYFKHMLALKEKENDGYYGYSPTAKEKKALEKPWLDRGDGHKWSDKEIINGLATNDVKITPKVMNHPSYMLQDQGDHYTIWVKDKDGKGRPSSGIPKGYRNAGIDLDSKAGKDYFDYMFGRQKANDKTEAIDDILPSENNSIDAMAEGLIDLWGSDGIGDKSGQMSVQEAYDMATSLIDDLIEEGFDEHAEAIQKIIDDLEGRLKAGDPNAKQEAPEAEAAKPKSTEEKPVKEKKPTYQKILEKVSEITGLDLDGMIANQLHQITSWKKPPWKRLTGDVAGVFDNGEGGKVLTTPSFIDPYFDEKKDGIYSKHIGKIGKIVGARELTGLSNFRISRYGITMDTKTQKDVTFSMAEGKFAGKHGSDYMLLENTGDIRFNDNTVSMWGNGVKINANIYHIAYFKYKYGDRVRFYSTGDTEKPIFAVDKDYNFLGLTMPIRSAKYVIDVENAGKALRQAIDAKLEQYDKERAEEEQLSDEEINRRLETGEAIPVTALGDKLKVNDDGTFTVGNPNQTILEDLGPNPVEVKGEALQAVFEQLKKIGIDVVFDAKPLQDMAERLKEAAKVRDFIDLSGIESIKKNLQQYKDNNIGAPLAFGNVQYTLSSDIRKYLRKGQDDKVLEDVKKALELFSDFMKAAHKKGDLTKEQAGKATRAKQQLMKLFSRENVIDMDYDFIGNLKKQLDVIVRISDDTMWQMFFDDYAKGLANISKIIRDNAENRAFVDAIFKEIDELRRNNPELIKTPNGEIMGMFDGEKIILDPDKINAGTTVHEYVHFWDAIVQRTNPKLWSRGVELLKQTPLWNKIANSRAYAHLNGNENRIASEVHARLSANDGALKLKELEDAGKTSKDIISELKKWVKDVWNEVKSTFVKWSGADLDRLTVEEFNNMPMRDLFGASTAMKNRVASFKRDSKGNPVVEFNISSEEKATHVIDGVEYTFDPKAQRDEMRAQMQAIGMTEAEMKETEEFFDYIKSETIRLSNQHRRFGEWQKALAERIINKTGQLSPVVNAFVANGEYKFNIDLGTSCIRRESRAAALLYLVMEKKIDQIGPAELAAIDDVLRAAGLNIACKCCFVEARRVRQLDSATTVAFQWRAVIEALGISKPQNVIENIADPKSRVGVESELTEDQLERLNMMVKNPKKAYELFVKKEDKKDGATNNGITAARMKEIATIINADKRMAGLLYPQDIMLAQGADKLQRTFYNSGWESFIKKVDGAGTAKPAHGFAIFDALSFVLNYDSTIRDEDGNLDKDKVISKLAEIYAIGGMRAQSFSDFNVMLAFDYAQMINEMAARQLPIHMYTKVPALIELFGTSRAMFNMSFVPDVLFSETVTNPDGKKVKNPAGLKFHRDENGNVVWFRDKNGKWANEYDYVWAEESFPTNKAYELRDRDEYEGRVGIIAIGVSPEQIAKMRKDGVMDMIIPYHSSNMPIEVTSKTGFDEAHGVTDYEEVQHTKTKNPFYDKDNARDSEWISLTAYNEKIKDKIKALKEKLVANPTTKKQIAANNKIEAEIKSYEAMKLGPSRMEYRYNSILRLVHFIYQQKTNAGNGLVREDSLDKEYIEGMSKLLGRDIRKDLGKMSAEELKKSSDIAADIYLEWCKKLGYAPKFEELLTGEDGKEGYYKVLEDFRGYDKNGNPVPQLPLRLRNIENFSEILEKYIIERSEALDEIERVFSADDETKQKLLDVVKYQRVNRDVRNKMVTRLNNLIGKANLKIMKTDELLDLLESSEVDPAKVHELRNNKNELYGFTFGGKIYLNEDRFNANTPAHEFTHIWCFAVMKARPDIWKQGKILLRRYHGKSWKRLYKGREAGYEALKLNEDAVASELLSRLVGQESEKITSELLGNIHQTRLKTSGAMDVRIKQWMNKFFKAVRNIFKIEKDKIEDMTMDEFLHAPLSAFWGIGSSSADIIKTSKRRDGTYKESIKSPSTIFKESTKKAKGEAKTQPPEFMLAGEKAETAPVANLEKAKLMNKDRKVKFGLNINPGGKANDFVEKILSGLKTVETRTGYAARNYIDKVMSVGDRIGIISNGKIVGYATIAERIIYKDKDEFKAAYKDHLVDADDPKYGWPKNGDIKVGYRLTDVERFNYPLDAPAYEKGTPYSYRDISDSTDEGETDESIWEETGWVKGRDGKWRFEIPDNLDAISFDRFLKGKATIVGLGAIYDNPKLYQAYPWLARVKVSLKNLKDILGEADTGGIENGDPRYAKITLDRKTLLKNEKEQRKTLIHEIQHMIQAYEGFARGGAASTFEGQRKSKKRAKAIYYNLAGEQEARYVERRAEAKQAMEELERLGWQDMSYEEAFRRLNLKEKIKYVGLVGAAHNYDRIPMPHNADAVITFDGKTVAAKYTVDSDVYHYTEGNGKADLNPKHARIELIDGKRALVPGDVGDIPKNYKPSKVVKTYKLVKLYEDGSFHPLFAGIKTAWRVGDTLVAEGFASLKDRSTGTGRVITPRYALHSGVESPMAPHLIRPVDFEHSIEGSYDGDGVDRDGHAKLNNGKTPKAVFIELWADMSKDYTRDVRNFAKAKREYNRTHDQYDQVDDDNGILGLAPFGGSYMFTENNLSMWICSSSAIIGRVVSEEERQDILNKLGVNERQEFAENRLPALQKAQISSALGNGKMERALNIQKMYKKNMAECKKNGWKVPDDIFAYRKKAVANAEGEFFKTKAEYEAASRFIKREKDAAKRAKNKKLRLEIEKKIGKKFKSDKDWNYYKFMNDLTGEWATVKKNSEEVAKRVVDFADVEAELNKDKTPDPKLKNIKMSAEQMADAAIEDAIERAVPVKDSELSSVHKLLNSFAKKMGAPINWTSTDGFVHGWKDDDGNIYLNVDSKMPITQVFWHETFHWLKANNEALFKDMMDYFEKVISPEQLDAYREKIGRLNLNDIETIEEMLADDMEDASIRSDILQKLGYSNPSLAKKFISWVKRIMDKFVEALHGKTDGLTTEQRDAFLDEFDKIAERALNTKEAPGKQEAAYSADLNEQEKADKSAFDMVVSKFRSAIGLKNADDLADEKIFINPPKSDPNYISPWNRLFGSPSRYMKKSEVFKTFQDRAAVAMKHLRHDRSFFNRKLDEILGMSSNDERNIIKSEEEKQDLYNLLLEGDAEGKEWTEDDVKNLGYNDNVLKAYKRIRGLIKKMYHMIDDARRAAQRRSIEVDSVGLSRLKRNRFVDEILAVYRIDKNGNPVGNAIELRNEDETDVTGQRFLVLYFGGPFTQRKYIFTDKGDIDKLKERDAVQVDHVRAIRRKRGKNAGSVVYEVFTNEGIPHVGWLDGYISHFFHEYMINVVDEDGNIVGTIGSGRTQREAVGIAEEWLAKPWGITSRATAEAIKDSFGKRDRGELTTGKVAGELRKGRVGKRNGKAGLDFSGHDGNPRIIDAEEITGLQDGQRIMISPKAYNFAANGMSADNQKAFAVSLHEFNKIAQAMASSSEMTLEEAKEALSKKARIDGKHRFLGNVKHREGVAGYEKDLDYVLRHYFNIGCRYAALEKYFKPKAIYDFERYFGSFNREHSGLAQYCKEFIQDVNGTPSSWEQTLNQLLMKSDFYRNFIAAQYGERAALALGNKITNVTSVLTLGCLNPSVGLINLTQMMNSIAYIGEMKAVEDIIKYGAVKEGGYTREQLRVLYETGVLDDVGMENASGYDKGRTTVSNTASYLGKAGQFSMMPFKLSEEFIRRGTVLAAYEAAKRRGMGYTEAVAYAKSINDKSNFNYGVEDAPNIFRRGSIVSQIMLQFKKYPVKELEVMRDMLPFLSPQTSAKQKAMFWGIYFACAGLMGFPIIDLPDDLLDGDLKAAMKKFIYSLGNDYGEGGRMLANAILYGIPSAFNINVSQRVGMSDVVPSTKWDLLGAIPSKLHSLIVDANRGDWRASIRDISPGLYNFYMAGETLATGSAETHGKRGRVMNRYESWYEAFLRAMGFRSMRETNNADVDQIIRKEKRKASSEKQEAIDRFIANPTNDNRRELQRLGIDAKQVKEERMKKKMDKRQRLESELNPKQKRQFRGLMNYAR